MISNWRYRPLLNAKVGKALVFVWASIFSLGAVGATLLGPTAQKLVQIEEKLAASDAGERQQGITQLESLAADLQQIPYDRAIVQRRLAYAYAEWEEYLKAYKLMQEIVGGDALSDAEQTKALLVLGQMALAVEKHEEAVQALEAYLRREEEPEANSLLLLGNAYIQLENYGSAITALERLLTFDAEPQEQWLNLYFIALFQHHQYEKALPVIQTLVEMVPEKKSYWKNWLVIHTAMDRQDKALTVRQLMYEKGHLTSGDELIMLAQHYLQEQQPYAAANLIQTELDAGNIENTEKNLRLLAQAWLQAQEDTNAIAALEKVAPVSSEGKLFMQLAQRYYHREEWQKVAVSVGNALQKGGVDKGQALMLKAMAHYQSGDARAAEHAFEQASEYESVREQSLRWVAWLRDNA